MTPPTTVESLNGLKVAITGAFSEMKRAEATARLKSLGALVTGSVSGKTQLLVAGARAGSKLAKAEQLGIEVWDEAKLIEMLAGSSVPEVAAEEPAKVVPSAFTGKTIVLTGTFATMKRTDAKKVLLEAGAKVSGSISKKTDLLIHGSDAGSKLAKAQKLGVATMTETEMVEALAAAGAGSAVLDGAAEKMAAKEAKEAKTYGPLRKAIAEANREQIDQYGMTVGQLLKVYLDLFAKRADIKVTKDVRGGQARESTLKKWWRSLPVSYLAAYADLGPLEFVWAFADASPEDAAEGAHGGRINLTGVNKFRWWKTPEINEFETWSAQNMADELQAEGSTFISYDPGERSTDALLFFDDANSCERVPMGTMEDYLTAGAKLAFVWYWQASNHYGSTKDLLTRLFDGSMPLETPEDEVIAALVGKGASEDAAKALVAWLGDEAVVLLDK